MKIAAVIVTYNRCAVLAKTLAAVEAQTKAPNLIIVVDNASADGTHEWLAQAMPRVRRLRLAENVGYGAGLAAGMRLAHEQGYGRYWLLDDDSQPATTALERLVKIVESDPDIGLAGLSGGDWRRGPRHWKAVPKTAEPVASDPRTYYCDFVLIDGALTTRAAVDACGFPREDFFMMFEDLEYSRRIGRMGFKIAVLLDQMIDRNHLGSSGIGGAVHPWRAYYQTRNHLRMVLETRSLPELVWWAWRQVKFSCAALRSPSKFRLQGVWMRARGCWDAVIGRMGKTVEPKVTPHVEAS